MPCGSVATFIAAAKRASLLPALPTITLCGRGTAAALSKVSFTGWPAFTVRALALKAIGFTASGFSTSSWAGPVAAGAAVAGAAVAVAGAAVSAAAAGAGASTGVRILRAALMPPMTKATPQKPANRTRAMPMSLFTRAQKEPQIPRWSGSSLPWVWGGKEARDAPGSRLRAVGNIHARPVVACTRIALPL